MGEGATKFHVPATLPSVNEASVLIGYGAWRGGLEPVWTLWIREKFGHTGRTLLALLTELSKAFIRVNMEKLMSRTRVGKEQRGL